MASFKRLLKNNAIVIARNAFCDNAISIPLNLLKTGIHSQFS